MAVVNAISYMRPAQLQRVLISTLIRPCLAKGEGYMCMLLWLKGICIYCHALSSFPLSFSVYVNRWIQCPRATSVHTEQQPTVQVAHHTQIDKYSLRMWTKKDTEKQEACMNMYNICENVETLQY